uniref:Ovule protein n=1 Tax=Caenorhabditis tropicalis TaxID=1561998 RepID=A0A1I7TBD7_9PELO
MSSSIRCEMSPTTSHLISFLFVSFSHLHSPPRHPPVSLSLLLFKMMMMMMGMKEEVEEDDDNRVEEHHEEN